MIALLMYTYVRSTIDFGSSRNDPCVQCLGDRNTSGADRNIVSGRPQDTESYPTNRSARWRITGLIVRFGRASSNRKINDNLNEKESAVPFSISFQDYGRKSARRKSAPPLVEARVSYTSLEKAENSTDAVDGNRKIPRRYCKRFPLRHTS